MHTGGVLVKLGFKLDEGTVRSRCWLATVVDRRRVGGGCKCKLMVAVPVHNLKVAPRHSKSILRLFFELSTNQMTQKIQICNGDVNINDVNGE